jgi:predicted YcjX-like family ATPase
MTSRLSQAIDDALSGARSLFEFGSHLLNPTIRLGVTGMSGAGKTVFITALVHGLIRGGRFPVFEALAGGRIADARLAPQPDDAVPRFDYETHLRALVEERRWPESTRRVSELRVIIEYQSQRGAMRTLTLDIVDYPGEWLLDLPLLNKSYEQWSAESIALSWEGPRKTLAAKWHEHLKTLAPQAQENEQSALTAAALFTDYLKSCRDQRFAMSVLPPGRFLMPGDLEGSLWAMMQRRYEAYKNVVVRPFFHEHFARLDRQIVLVDVLSALNAGPEALQDLERALASILACFRPGKKSFLTALFSPRIDRILFAATKADHLHRSSHDSLEAILRQLTASAVEKAEFAGAEVDVIALAAVRATREATIKQGHSHLPAILGVPAPGEIVGSRVFDGKSEAAMFPGDLPDSPKEFFADAGSFRGLSSVSAKEADFRFPKLLPPSLQTEDNGKPALPQIRLDRALQFLIGDRLQ